MADDPGEWVRVGAHHDVDVIVANAPRDFPGLFTRELHRRERQRCFRGTTLSDVMHDCRNRMTNGGFGRRTVLSKRDRSDEIRPRTARIVRKPETVRGEDEMSREHHER